MGHNGSNATTKLKIFVVKKKTKLKIFEMNDLDGQALFVSKRCSLLNNNNNQKKTVLQPPRLFDCRAMIEGLSGIVYTCRALIFPGI
jgi:hypothetical protein